MVRWIGLAALLFVVGCGDAGVNSGQSVQPAADVAVVDSAAPAAECAVDADCPKTSNLCAPLRCVDTRCVESPVVCDDAGDSVCLRNGCDPKSGACAMRPAPKGTPCADDDPCSVDDRCEGGECKAGPFSQCECQADSDCAPFSNKCLGARYCDKTVVPFKCAVDAKTVVQCDDDQLGCFGQVCVPSTGKCLKKLQPDGALCNDGDPCTANDRCKDGECKAEVNVCVCKTNADCEPQEDGDVCNGTLFCDQSTSTCKVNPATLISCPSVNDTACVKNVCNPATGQCGMGAVKNGTPCDDGEACTTGDLCIQGQCSPGGNVCDCLKDSDCAAKDDGDLCNGTLFCDKTNGKCVFNPATVVVCPTAGLGACLSNSCKTLYDAAKLPVAATCTVTATKDGKACDDGDPCTNGEVCAKGQCGGGAEVCQCQTDADCKAKDDGDLCNGTMFCNQQTGACQINPATVVTCQSVGDTACLKNQCQPTTGKCMLTPAPVGTTCDDGDACTKGDLCANGLCQSGPFACACKVDSDCVDPDGDKCTGVPYCDKSQAGKYECKANPASAVYCSKSEDTACVQNQCDPKSGKCGLKPVKDGQKCDDDNPCTTQGSCKGGVCGGLTNLCKCQVDSDCVDPDGDQCTGVPYCDKTVPGKHQCKPNPASVVLCSPKDDTACLKAQCEPKSGKCLMVASKDATACDDGTACTKGDACAGGKCVGTKLDCNDGDPCTTDSCNKDIGCVYGKSSCDDGNPCTVDSCNSKTGACTNDKVAAQGKLCDADGNGCTVNDACDGGACKKGTPVICTGEVAECQSLTCASTSKSTFTCVKAPSKDGSPCADGASCQLGALCKQGKCTAGTADTLFAVKKKGPLGSKTSFVGVAPTSSGWWAGGARAGGEAGVGKRAWFLSLTDAAGADKLKGGLIAHAAKNDGVGVVGVSVAAEGLFAVGAVVNAAGNLDLRLEVRSASDGSLVLGKTVGDPNLDDRAVKAVPLGSGGWVVAGATGAVDKGKASLWRLSTGGLLGWTHKSTLEGSLRDVAVDTSGDIWAVGQAVEAAKAVGLVTQVSTLGASKGQWTLKDAAPQALTAAVAVTGGLQAVGWRGVAGAESPWLVRVDGAGKVLWQKLLNESFRPTTLALHGGGWVAAGDYKGVVGRDARVLRLDASFNPVWKRNYEGGGDELLTSLSVSAKGRVMAAGHAGKTPQVGLLWSMNPWGHDSCQGAGKCATVELSKCADANACTDDLCDPLSGCVASSNVNLCDDGDGCTAGDQCLNASCKAGVPIQCDDKNPCTKDTCDPKKGGCVHSPVADFTPCGTGNSCLGGVCSKKWAVDIEAAGELNCVVGLDGKVRCWGGSYDLIGKPSLAPVEIPKLEAVKSLSISAKHACAVAGESGMTFCWGAAHYGETGIGKSNSTSPVPLVVTGLPQAVWVKTGGRHSCVYGTDKATWCFGKNAHSFTLGGGFKLLSTLPSAGNFVEVPVKINYNNLKSFALADGGSSQGSVNEAHMCAIWGSAGQVFCNGRNQMTGGALPKGIIGQSFSTSFVEPSKGPAYIPQFFGAAQVVAGSTHTCFLKKTTNDVYCVGAGDQYQTGNGKKAHVDKPVKVYGLPEIASIEAYGHTSCAVTKTGEVWCWGDNSHGKQGVGDALLNNVPRKMKNVSNAIKVSCGEQHCCVLMATGEVRCSGRNMFGQLGVSSAKVPESHVPITYPPSAPK